MESEKVKEIKKVLEEGQFNTINHHQKEGKPIKISFAEILTLINELESENESCHEVLADLKGIIKQQNDRIAELEKENAKYKRKLTTNQWVQEIRKEALKQFAERLIEKKVKLGERFNIYDIDETLKEFINKGDDKR